LFVLGNGLDSGYSENTDVPAMDPNSLPNDIDVLQKIVADLCERLQHESSEKNKYRSLLRELLDAQRNRKSEQLSKEQLALFETLWKASDPEAAEEEEDSEREDGQPQDAPEPPQAKKRSGRQPLARNVVRERIVHDLSEAEKHCDCCGKDLRLFDEEISERYEYIPASIKVIEDVRRKYACDCTVKTADKPAQPIEKSTANASLLAQVIVAKYADHLPLHRQAKMFARHGVELSDQTLCGWTAQCAVLLEPLYQRLKRFVLASKVVGTDDTPVKVLDRSWPQARKGRIWPCRRSRPCRGGV
jgi:transposase